MIPDLVALTSEHGEVDAADLAEIAGSLQKQVVRDFAPAWGPTCTVRACPDPSRIPVGYWPIIIVPENEMPQGALGFHASKHHEPVCYVEHQSVPETATTCSHELLEALADRSGNRKVVATIDGERVRVLVEVCDPCEAVTYDVDGLPMSDFVLPPWYGPHRWRNVPRGGINPAGDVAVTFCRSIGAPLTIIDGGYFSYQLPNHEWAQETWWGGKGPSTRILGEAPSDRMLRSWIDEQARLARHTG